MPFKGKIAAATIGAVKAGRIRGLIFAADACNWNQTVAIRKPKQSCLLPHRRACMFTLIAFFESIWNTHSFIQAIAANFSKESPIACARHPLTCRG